MRKRNKTLRKKCFERDHFTCQKCKLEDKEKKVLEAHHIVPLCMGGKDELSNLIAFCSDCHRFAPNHEDEFYEYLSDECEGTLTILIKAWKKCLEEHGIDK